jgi:hypothetical protein
MGCARAGEWVDHQIAWHRVEQDGPAGEFQWELSRMAGAFGVIVPDIANVVPDIGRPGP